MDEYALDSSQSNCKSDDDDILEYVSALASSNYRSTLTCLADNLESSEQEEEQSSAQFSFNKNGEKSQYLENMENLKHALTEKDKDLQLAARIGKCLLERNQQLQNVNDHLENQISVVNEELVQLKHELQQKMEILKRWTQENQCTSDFPPSDRKINTLNSLERKLTTLEEENAGLKLE
uniref:HAP1 N-terminal domain-containing protein n=1 Tax=Romanomermis culicivorax TaxID=13658 RepID=A0A915LCM5_ROMCU